MTDRTCITCGVPTPGRGGRHYCSEACKPRCTAEGCASPARKRSWCASHYAQSQRTGTDPVPFAYKWSDPEPCLVCGDPPGEGLRRFCSSACRVLHVTYSGHRPRTTACIMCGATLDLLERGPGGQRRKASVRLCQPCRRDYRNHGSTVEILARRDGTQCGICGENVDLTVGRADTLMCASIDHITPRACGGSHAPSNLQLAHLLCNMRKGADR